VFSVSSRQFWGPSFCPLLAVGGPCRSTVRCCKGRGAGEKLLIVFHVHEMCFVFRPGICPSVLLCFCPLLAVGGSLRAMPRRLIVQCSHSCAAPKNVANCFAQPWGFLRISFWGLSFCSFSCPHAKFVCHCMQCLIWPLLQCLN
jgi:hypothetical protein